MSSCINYTISDIFSFSLNFRFNEFSIKITTHTGKRETKTSLCSHPRIRVLSVFNSVKANKQKFYEPFATPTVVVKCGDRIIRSHKINWLELVKRENS